MMTFTYDRQMKKTDDNISLRVELDDLGDLVAASAFCEVFDSEIDCTNTLSKDDRRMARVRGDFEAAKSLRGPDLMDCSDK